MKRLSLACLLASLLAALFLTARPSAAQTVPAPDSHFDTALGTDGALASWTSIVAYYRKLGEASDRVQVRTLGETTLGNPFLQVLISAPENLANADRLAEINRTLADPRGQSDADLERFVEEGKSTVAVTAGLHSTEVAATQMAPRLAYRLASSDDPRTQRILEETVFLLFPCFNPDGTEMVVNWSNETNGTDYQGARYPDLYHHYAGHDNNRDAYMLNLKESQLFAQAVYREWLPQLYLDVHQMGSYGARLYLPPYEDPINPNVDPLVWMEHELVGANMQLALEREGVTGVVSGAPFTGWWFPSFHMVTNHHNIAGMLTETASSRMAWPLYIHPQQLEPEGRGHSVYGPMQPFPHPWDGGWWRLEDMMRQQEVSTYALLETAAKNREMLLQNMIAKAQRTIERGRTEAPYAFVVPARQHDPRTVEKFVGKLILNGIEVQRAEEDFVQDGRAYAEGDFVVSLAQPNGVLAKSLLAEAHYPDDPTTRRADGSVIPPYDMANFVLAEHMGVTAHPTQSPVEVPLTALQAAPKSAGAVRGSGQAGWLTSHAANDAFHVTNRLLAEGGEVYWLEQPIEQNGMQYAPGALWIPASATSASQIETFAQDYGLSFQALAEAPEGAALALQPLRLGMYRRYLGGNMDEGWTRYLFDEWEFPYERVEIDQIREGALDDLDVFLIPKDEVSTLMGEREESLYRESQEAQQASALTEQEFPEVFLPPEYKQGFDESAFGTLLEFVQQGGTLVLLDDASHLASGPFNLPVEDVTDGLPREEYFNPGSMMRARFDITHPLAYGMPTDALLLNWSSPAFEITPSALNEDIAAPITYPESDLLKSGWLIGEDHISGKAAALDVSYGDGQIVLLGFRPQHRAQTHGTFKVFFNALYYGASERVDLPEAGT